MEIKPEALKQSIHALVKLQEIDAKVFRLNSEIKSPPPTIVELQKKLDEADRVFKSAERMFRDADRERRALELKSLTLTQDVKRAEAKKSEVRNTKEEFAAGKELDNFRKQIGDLKTSLEAKTNLSQQKAAARDDKQKILSELQEQMKNLQEERSGSLSGLKTQLEALEKQRAEYISKVDETVFSLYERVQKIRKGSGVALVKENICGGCFVTVPPLDRLQLSKMATIVTCSGCSRILFPGDEIESLEPNHAQSA